MDYSEHEFTYNLEGIGPLEVAVRIDHNEVGKHPVLNQIEYDDSVSEFTVTDEDGKDVTTAMRHIPILLAGEKGLIPVYDHIESEALKSWLKS